MEPENNITSSTPESTEISVPASKRITLPLVSVVVTALLVGGGVWALMNQRAAKDQKELQDQLTSLQNTQAGILEDESDATAAPTSEPSAEPAITTRSYSNSFFSFEYPSDVIPVETYGLTSSAGPSITVEIITKNAREGVQLAVPIEIRVLSQGSPDEPIPLDEAFLTAYGVYIGSTLVEEANFQNVKKSMNAKGVNFKYGEMPGMGESQFVNVAVGQPDSRIYILVRDASYDTKHLLSSDRITEIYQQIVDSFTTAEM